MILFQGKYGGILLCTPPRTGTNSQESVAARTPRSKIIYPRHRSSFPKSATVDRYLTVRNPYDRLVSMYMHLTSGVNRYLRVKERGLTFDEFLFELMQDRNNETVNCWTMNLAEYIRDFEPTTLMTLNDLEKFWLKEVMTDVSSHCYSTQSRRAVKDVTWTSSRIDLVSEYVEPEIEAMVNFPRYYGRRLGQEDVCVTL